MKINPLDPQVANTVQSSNHQILQTHSVTPDLAARTVAANDLLPNGQKVLKDNRRDKAAKRVRKVNPTGKPVDVRLSDEQARQEEEKQERIINGYSHLKGKFFPPSSQ